MSNLRAFIHRALTNLGRKAAAGAVVHRESLEPARRDVSLHMVISHGMLSMGLLGLRSLEFHTRRHWAPFIHDDGTLTEADVREISERFPDATVISRAQADREVTAALAPYPHCQENRLKHHWFLKVFDTRHYAPGERYIVIDSDIVFFRRPEAVLRWIDGEEHSVWVMKDTREKYSSKRSELEKAMGFPFWEAVNSGFDLMPKAAADLSLAETFLERCAPIAREYGFLEQTIFCLFASAWKEGGGHLPGEYEISWSNFRRPGAVCRHYVGPTKNAALFSEGGISFWWQSRGARRAMN